MDRSCTSQSRHVAQKDARIIRFSYMRLLLVKLHKRRGVRPAFSVIFARVYEANGYTTASITKDTLHKVWDELNYRFHTCHVTPGAHIEFL